MSHEIPVGSLRITCEDGTASTTHVEVLNESGGWTRLAGITRISLQTLHPGQQWFADIRAYASGGLNLVVNPGDVTIEPCPCGIVQEVAP